MSLVDKRLEKYIRNIQPLCNGFLGDIQKGAYAEELPIMANDTLRLLGQYLDLLKPKRILEIGTCIGFSALYMSSFLPKDGELVTIDRYPYMIERAKENFAKYDKDGRITLIEGQANDVVPELDQKGERFDFILMDAAKGQYISFLPHCINMLNTGGILFTDDIFQNGTVALKWEQIPHRQKTIYKRLNEFLFEITHNEKLNTALLTVDDGVAVSRKIGE